jgi:hypothetical protein
MLPELLLCQFESHPVLFFVAPPFFVHLVNGPRVGAAWKDFRRRVPPGRAWVEGAVHGSSLTPTPLLLRTLRMPPASGDCWRHGRRIRRPGRDTRRAPPSRKKGTRVSLPRPTPASMLPGIEPRSSAESLG